MDRIRGICDGLEPGTTTLQDAWTALGGGQITPAVACGTYSGPAGSPDVCDYGAAAGQIDFAFYQGDAGACAPTPSGPGCWYGCGVRTSQADWDANGQAATLCARFFYGPQLTPLIPR